MKKGEGLMRGFILLLSSALSLACSSESATPEQCRSIFSRLITLELNELGFQDPQLEKRWLDKLSIKYRADIDECIGKPIPKDALNCVQSAKNAEEVSHTCLE